MTCVTDWKSKAGVSLPRTVSKLVIREMAFRDYNGGRDGVVAERRSAIGASVIERFGGRAESGLNEREILRRA